VIVFMIFSSITACISYKIFFQSSEPEMWIEEEAIDCRLMLGDGSTPA